MKHIHIATGSLEGETIHTSLPANEIYDTVMAGTVMVIKNVFPTQETKLLRDLAFSWGQSQVVSSAANFYDQKNQNHYCVQQGVSKIQKTLHYYNSYNFNDLSSLKDTQLKELLMTFCLPLKFFYNSITGNTADFTGEQVLHPQIIHYPSGGGFFAKHFHNIEPQKIGLIVSLSKYGADFKEGGTGFEVEGDDVTIEPVHDIGDIGLFRFDLQHWVKPVDLEEAINKKSSRGRWSLVLPYY
jgi:hypothetical protein